jgi:flagellar biosynthesis GTPase FlhF
VKALGEKQLDFSVFSELCVFSNKELPSVCREGSMALVIGWVVSGCSMEPLWTTTQSEESIPSMGGFHLVGKDVGV